MECGADEVSGDVSADASSVMIRAGAGTCPAGLHDDPTVHDPILPGRGKGIGVVQSRCMGFRYVFSRIVQSIVNAVGMREFQIIQFFHWKS